jgi:transcription elongation factor GreA
MFEKAPMTPEGYQKLQDELKRLKAEERPRIIAAIEEARGHGDLTENAEYDAAKDRQQQLDIKIQEIEDRLSRAQVIRPEDVKGDRVVFGATVVLKDRDRERKVTYQIVGETETDSSRGKISIKSPIGKAMIGKSVGELFYVETPAGEREYQVEEIKFE